MDDDDDATNHCLACHYALAGLAQPRCPECSHAFDPSDPATTTRMPHPRRTWHALERWDVAWAGHTITVLNWWGPGPALLGGGEELFIDTTLCDRHAGGWRFTSDLHALLVQPDGGRHHVHAHVGSIDFGLRIGCRVFVDERLVGGDVGKWFLT